jgi:hypothetical protein
MWQHLPRKYAKALLIGAWYRVNITQVRSEN